MGDREGRRQRKKETMTLDVILNRAVEAILFSQLPGCRKEFINVNYGMTVSSVQTDKNPGIDEYVLSMYTIR